MAHDLTTGTPTAGDLVRLFEDSEDATLTARKASENDRDYYDDKQLTAKERATLERRGQPPVVINYIGPKIDFMVGAERSQRVDPIAYPNTPMHEQDAEGATMALRYVAEAESYDEIRSRVWFNMLVEGCGGISVRVEEKYGEPYICLKRIAWDRMFYDPHSAEDDFLDAAYLGVVTWMDFDDALALYPEGKEILETTLATSNPQDTYDDKPKFRVWADSKRKRVRICQIWLKRDEQWGFFEFTKGGILKGGPSPYRTDKGESDCELIFQSAYVDRENNRYGAVRRLKSIQDEINKRRSKSLHLLNTKQIIYRKDAGAVDDIERVRKEAAKPDGVIGLLGNPNNPINHDLQILDGTQLAAAQLGMLQEAKNDIDIMGPNATMLGEKASGSASASGKAILASQQGGMMQMGGLLDNLRHFDVRVFTAIWNRIRQFWNGEKWLRITDDERNVKWVGVNVDPMLMQQLQQQNPEAMQQIAGTVGNVAELDCDITISDAPDTLTPQLEQFEALVNLKQYDQNNELPFRAIVRAAPNLKDKDKILEEMDKSGEQQAQIGQLKEQLEIANAKAKIGNVEADTGLKQAQAHKALQPEAPQGGMGPAPDHPALTAAEIEDKLASATDKRAGAQLKSTQAMKTALEARLLPFKAAQEARDADRNHKINEMKARQKPKPTRAA